MTRDEARARVVAAVEGFHQRHGRPAPELPQAVEQALEAEDEAFVRLPPAQAAQQRRLFSNAAARERSARAEVYTRGTDGRLRARDGGGE